MLKVAFSSSVLLHCTTNVAGISWPVRYGEVATLAQEFFEGLSPRNDGVQAPFLTGSNGCYDH